VTGSPIDPNGGKERRVHAEIPATYYSKPQGLFSPLFSSLISNPIFRIMATATPTIPRMMRALALPKHCNPSEYGLASIPTPEISGPNEILVHVRAASVNPIDIKLAGDLGKMIQKAKYVPPL
jgi:hypothetical protein